MSSKAKLLIGAVIMAACISMLAAYFIEPVQPPELLKLAFGLACFAIAAELLVYKMPNGNSGSIALIPFLAIAMVSPSWHAIAAVGTCEVIIQLMHRREPLKAAYNSAQAVLSIAAAVVVYRLLGGASFALPQTWGHLVSTNAVPALAALSAVAIVNSSAISGIVALTTEQRFAQVWAHSTLGTAAYYLLAWPFGCGLAWVFSQVSAVAAVALAIPMVGVRQLYKTTLQLQSTNRELLELMVKAIEARDPYTSGHSRRVAQSATIIARGLGLGTVQIERVRIAALLHDIGKIHEVYAPILRKEGPLTKEEWAVMQTHPEKGAELVSTLSDLRDLVGAIRHHHENWNGTGYPDGIAGETIPLASRIITFADTIDALTTDRPYRGALTEADVRNELVRCRGSQFDPSICDAVLSQTIWFQLFPKATPAKLSVVQGMPNSKALRA